MKILKAQGVDWLSGSGFERMADREHEATRPATRRQGVSLFRRFSCVPVTGRALGLIACFFCSAAMAAPIPPTASTQSSLNLSVSLSNVLLESNSFSPTSSVSNATTAATALDPLGGLSGHSAIAEGSADSNARDILVNGGTVSTFQPIFEINMQHRTLAESWWGGPMGARAGAESSTGFSDVIVTATPGASITLDWDFDSLKLLTSSLASLAKLEHMVSIAVAPVSGQVTQPNLLSAGFSAVSRDGTTEWTAFDIPGSTAISDWLSGFLGQGNTPSAGPQLIIPLAVATSGSSTGEQDLKIAVEVSHLEYSTEAPLAPVRPVAERAGSEESGAMVHWDAETKRLSFDVLPLNQLLGAGGGSVSIDDQDDPLSGAYLEIDPLVFTGEFDEGGYFVGDGSVRLKGRYGEVLFEASLPGLAYDERLYDLEGLNLFGPLLNITRFRTAGSPWLGAFYERMNSDVYYLPELFIDIGRPAGLATAGDRWGADFTAATSAALSFAGPATVGLPNSIPLVLLGLFVLSITAPGCRRPFQSGLFSSR